MLDFLISPVMAGGAAGQAAGPGMMDFAFPAILLALFYFMLIRPQSKRAKAHRELVAALTLGDEKVTDGGMMGKISAIGENSITVEFSENMLVKMRRESIASVMPKGTLKKL